MKNVYRGLASIIAIMMFVQPVFALTVPDSTANSEKSVTSGSASYSMKTGSTLDITPLATSVASTKSISASTSKSLSNMKLSSGSYVEGEILVKYKKTKINLDTSSGRTKAANFATAKSFEKVEDLEKINISVLRIKDGKTVEQKIAELEKDPNVEYSQPNFQYYPATITTNDTQRGLLWGLDNTGQTVGGDYTTNNPGTVDKDIDAPESWIISESTTSASVIVAVIDDGVAYNHPDLLPNMWNGVNCVSDINVALGGCNHGYDFEDSDKTPLPTNDSHGTHIAGTIAAVKNNAKGIIGVAPQAKIMALKSSLTTAENVKAINFAKFNGAKIINASWAGSNYDQALKNTIASFSGIFIAASGNEAVNNEGTHSYPSDYDLDNIISVAATDQNDVLADFSNYGATSVDVGAPGTNIYSTIPSETNLVSETFEGVTPPNIPSGWTKSVTSNNWGTYELDSGSFWGNVLYGDLAVPYANSANTTITSPTYNLTAGGAYIDFWTKCDTEYITDGWADYMQLEYSANGTTFTVAVDPYSGEEFRWDEPTLDILNDEDPLNDTNGSTYHYTNISIPSQYLTSNFKFRLRWVTDSSVNDFDGCIVDDVKITKLSDGSDEQYGYIDGTSMATPQVAGLVALIEGYNPNLTTAQVKNVILTSGDSVESLTGKTVTGKRINAERALQAVNPAKSITSFAIPSQVGTTTINETAHTIALTVPNGTNVTALVPTIAITGASVSPLSGVSQNFTSPVTYTVTAADASTQTYSVTVTVAPAPDSTAPVITLNGTNPMNLNVGDTFSDPGATALDNIDGSVSVTPSGSVDTATVGTYTITYTATDTALNTASTTRTVNVFAVTPSDTTPPSITLIGSNPIDLTVGDAFSDPGATASDDIDGDITGQIVVVNPVNTSVADTYTVTYNVSDVAGNPATEITRTVTVHAVVDTTAPTIELTGDNPINLTVGDTFTEPGYTASDNIDGDITGSVTVGGDTVNINTPDTYTITYNVSDEAGNPAIEVTRVVNVSDADAPVFSGVPANYSLEATSASGAELSYTLPTATDNVDGAVLVTCTPESSITLSLGAHTIECSANDTAGNDATASFIVTIEDTTGPVISDIPSNQTIDITSGASAPASYSLPTASDVVDGSVSVVCTPESGSTFTLGASIVECSASDATSNETVESFTVTVNLIDETSPVITLNGDSTINIDFGETFTDPGATATDNIDGDITDEINITGSVNKNLAGTYVLTYTVEDTAGNEASVTRTIIVDEYVDTLAPVITLEGGPTLNIPTDSTFVDPGATATDNIDGNVTDEIVVSGAVNTAIIGSYTVTYSVTDTAGNNATSDRIVNVTDLSLSTEQQSTVASNSTTITWTTSHPATSRVLWDTISHSDASTTEDGPTNYGYANSTTEDSTLTTNHSVTVSALTPLTTYFFRPVSHGSPEMVGAEISVTTTATPSSGGGGGGGGGGSSSNKSAAAVYSVQINKGAPQATSTQVVLTISPVNNAKQMQISNTSSFASSTWIAFRSTYQWTLTSGSGVKTVYVRYGKNGKVVGSAQDTITLTEKIVPALTQPSQSVLQGQVLGASTYNFTTVLMLGSTGQDVIELQKILIATGYLKIALPTGFYGPMTEAAVKAYQGANNIEQTGVVGPSTHALLNKAISPIMNNEQKLLLIKELQAKLLELIKQLKALTTQ